MRFFFSGPRILGIRPGVILSANDFKRAFASPQKPTAAALPATFVYVIEGEAGKHKIGVSTDPIRRISELQTGSPVALKFSYIGYTPGSGYDIEAAAHVMLDQYKTSGEWFRVPASIAIGSAIESASRTGQTITQVQPDMVQTIISLAKETPTTATTPWIYRHPFVFISAIVALLWLAVSFLRS